MQKERTYKISKIIAIYVGLTLTGISLTFIAVYNASLDLEIHHKIDSLYNSTLETMNAGGGLNSLQSRFPEQAFYALSDIGKTKINTAHATFVIDQKFLDETRVNDLGGYSTNYLAGSSTPIIWALIPAQSGSGKIFALDKYSASSNQYLLLAYKNRLIIPAAFFIWMTVWGSFILRNLVGHIQAQKEAVEHMALHDALTGLANRNLFAEKLEEVWHYSKREKLPFTIAMMDLDAFKKVNDTYGHAAGDQLLQLVATRIRECVRKYDIVARTGGDEFLLLLPNTGLSESRTVCSRLLHEIIQPYIIEGDSLTIGASIGIASHPDDADTLVSLSQLADKAMYAAKNAGGGLHFYNQNKD